MSEKIDSWELDNLVDAVGRLYAKADTKRTLWDVWLHTCHHVGALAAALRMDTDQDAWMVELADTCLWFFTAIHRMVHTQTDRSTLALELESVVRISGRCSDIVWRRYALGCPSCVVDSPDDATFPAHPEPCDCDVRFPDGADLDTELRHKVPLLLDGAEARIGNRPTSLREWQDYLSQIFRPLLGYSDTNRPHMGYLLLEQVGSVSDALIRTYSYTAKRPPVIQEVRWRQTRLELELGRFISLLFLIPAVRGKDLADVVGWRYGPIKGGRLRCWACEAHECRCALRIAPGDVPVRYLLSMMA